MPAHTPYVRLTHGQKQTLREYFAADRTMTYKQLSLWVKAAYKLPQPPSRTTLHRVLREESSEVKQRDTAKTVRPVCCPTLEDMLLAWIRKCEEWKLLIVTGATIREKAAKIRDEIATSGPASAVEGLMRMRFSNGWLGKFLKRHALTSKRVHGEAASVKQAAIERGREALRQITKDYALCDVFNMNETAYFYCAPPTRSISARPIAGRKAAKKRLTIAVACNADGSTKLPLLFIGSSRQPRCFHGKPCADLGVDYTSTPKAWMNTQVFQCWAARFNEHMRAENRHVLLLLDNASSYRVDEPLSNVAIAKLPPNTTSVLQPQDAGIIRQFKLHVLKRKNRHALDAFDQLLERASKVGCESLEKELDKIYYVDVLEAMRWAQEAWESVTATTISNCWRHTSIVDSEMYDLIESVEKLRIGH